MVKLEQLSFCCLTFCSLRYNEISAEGVCALVRVFQVNQSLQKLKLSGWVQPFSSSFKRCVYTETVVSLPVLCWNISRHLETFAWPDGCVHSWLMITALIIKSSPFVTNNWMCISKYIVFDNKESIVLNKFIVWYCKFLYMHATPSVLWGPLCNHQPFQILWNRIVWHTWNISESICFRSQASHTW